MAEPSVLVAPNDDGFGPSSLGFHLVRELVRRGFRVAVRAGRQQGCNRQLHASAIASGEVAIEPAEDLLYLEATADGRLDVAASLAGLAGYPDRRRACLARPLGAHRLVIDLGVPALARAAHDQGIPCFTVFDHSWAETCRRLAAEGGADAGVREAIALLEEDESRTRRVFLFPSPLAPRPFQEHWRRLCPHRLTAIPGVFGAPPEPGPRLLPHPPGARSLLVVPGGTRLWDDLLVRLVLDWARREPALTAYVFVRDGVRETRLRPELARLGHELGGPEPRSRGDAGVDVFPVAGSPRVRLLGTSRNATYQTLLSEVDAVVSRAGGATVNDAVACRVPLLLVPQPGHAQVEAIRAEALLAGMALEVPFESFRDDPAAAIETAMAAPPERFERIRRALEAIPREQERPVVASILREAGLA